MVQRIRRKPRDAPFNTAGQHGESWQARALDAASLWMEARGDWRPNGDRPLRVADFGAGNERLRDVLSDRLGQSFSYFPYDLHPQRPTSVKLNLLEETPPESYDLVFALGLLEYLPPENDFLTRLRSRCRFALVSFVFVGSAFAGGLSEREALGWQAHDDREGFERRFGRAGFARAGARVTNEGQTGLWLWESVPHEPAVG